MIRLWSGGGGGFGDPMTRDPALVEEDVANGLVSVERARDVYGVVPGDAAATASLRAAPRAAGDAFDFGTARSEWERIHGEAAERIGAFLPSLPVGRAPLCPGRNLSPPARNGRRPLSRRGGRDGDRRGRQRVRQPSEPLKAAAE